MPHCMFQLCPACDCQYSTSYNAAETLQPTIRVDMVDAVEGLETRAGNTVHDWRQPMLHRRSKMAEQKKLQLWLIRSHTQSNKDITSSMQVESMHYRATGLLCANQPNN